MKLSVSVFILFLIKRTTFALDLCAQEIQNNVTENVASYRDFSVQNCGCANDFCIRKCCKPGYSLGSNSTCEKIDVNDGFSFKVPVYRKKTKFFKNISDISIFMVGVLNCSKYVLEPSDRADDEYFIQENGELWMPLVKNGLYYTNTHYCVDEQDGLSVFVCFLDDAEALGRNFNAFGMIISMPFLLATFLVYAALPDRNVHQRALMFYVLTLFLSYVLLVTINLTEDLEAPACEILAYFTLFFFMVSFFWMNVICFDIYYTFSGGRGFIGSKRASERRRFLVYSLYAWGLPLIHIVIVYLLQTFLDPNSDHNPRIGDGKCFLADGWPNLWYFYGEAAILILVNIVFFLVTAYKIRQVKKETSMLKQNDSKRHTYEKDKQRFNLFLKLLLAMGVNWSMEVISWAVNWQTSDQYYQVWYVTDFFNAMYGVFIFFIFVFKKKIWKLLQKRYYNLVGKPHLARSMTTTQTRTSHYSSGNYSTADTTLSDRTNINNGARPEEMALRRV